VPHLSSRTAVLRAATAVLAVGVATAPTACATSTPEAGGSAAPSASAPAVDGTATSPPAPTATPPGDGGTDPILRGERQVVLRPIGSFESILAVDAKGRLNLTDGDTESSLFVLLPAAGNRYQIRTAKVRGHGEPDCMGLRDNGAAPTTVVAAPCDAARPGQMFTVERTRATDEGRPTYTIGGQGGVHLRVRDEEGLVAQRVDAGAATTFDLVDNGAAPPGPGE
jgi:hypothetical protein